MPEGPCLRRWCEVAQQFSGHTITKITGTSTVFDKAAWEGAVFATVQVYGKQMFVQLKRSSHMLSHNPTVHDDKDCLWLRYHFLMWGSLHANQYKGPSKRSKTKVVPNPRMVLHFHDDKFLAFYGGSLRHVDGPCVDTGVDVLSDTFNKEKAALAILQETPVCYTLMDQDKFAGVGNIIKNEVLYRTNTHPLELGSNLTKTQAKKIAEQVVTFTNSWMEWEKEPKGKTFSEQMMIYWKFKCPLGHSTKRGWFGDELKRMTVWCPQCQTLIKESDIYHQEIVNTKKVKRSSHKTVNDEGDTLAVNKKVSKKRKIRGEPKGKAKKAKTLADVETSEEDFDGPGSKASEQSITGSSICKRKRTSSKVVTKKKMVVKTNAAKQTLDADGNSRKSRRKLLLSKNSVKNESLPEWNAQSDSSEVKTRKTSNLKSSRILCLKTTPSGENEQSKSRDGPMYVKKGIRQSARLAKKR